MLVNVYECDANGQPDIMAMAYRVHLIDAMPEKDEERDRVEAELREHGIAYTGGGAMPMYCLRRPRD